MEDRQIVKIQLSSQKKRGLYLTFFLSLAIGIGWIVLSRNLAYGSGRFVSCVLGVISLYIFVFCSYCIYQLKKIDFNAVTVTNESITDWSTGYHIGTVLWKDVTAIKVMQDMSNLKYEYMVLVVRNPQEYIAKEKNAAKRRSLMLRSNFYGSPICISTRALDCSFEVLQTVIMDKYQQYRETHSETAD